MVELREFAPSDVPELISWIDGPETLALWSGNSGFTWPLDEDQVLRYTDTAGPRLKIWTAVDEADPAEAIGHASLALDPPGWTGRLAKIMVAPSARRRGVGAGLVTAALRIAFDVLDVHRVSLGVYAHNAPAIRLYERLGFTREGLLRETTHVHGRWWSSIEMGILEEEWRTRRP